MTISTGNPIEGSMADPSRRAGKEIRITAEAYMLPSGHQCSWWTRTDGTYPTTSTPCPTARPC